MFLLILLGPDIRKNLFNVGPDQDKAADRDIGVYILIFTYHLTYQIMDLDERKNLAYKGTEIYECVQFSAALSETVWFWRRYELYCDSFLCCVLSLDCVLIEYCNVNVEVCGLCDFSVDTIFKYRNKKIKENSALY